MINWNCKLMADTTTSGGLPVTVTLNCEVPAETIDEAWKKSDQVALDIMPDLVVHYSQLNHIREDEPHVVRDVLETVDGGS